MPLLINGRYLTRPVTGVERYSDMLLQVVASEWPDSRIAVPGCVQGEFETYGLKVIRVGWKSSHAWEQIELPMALRKGDVLLCPANTGPFIVKRQVVVMHDLAVFHHPEWFSRPFAAWYRFLLPRLARRAARIITVSEYSAQDIQEHFSLPAIKVHVVPPFAQSRSNGNAKADIGAPYYLMVGSLNARKGYDDVLAWWTRTVQPPIKLVIVGRSNRLFRSSMHAAHDGVIWLDEVNDDLLSALYEDAIALIQPSRFEGFGLPILEAFYHDCPVIAADLPVYRTNFGTAVRYAQVGDHLSMLAAMAALNEKDRRSAYIKAGRYIAASYTPERTSRDLRAALAPLLNT